jgi:hypothetical protein
MDDLGMSILKLLLNIVGFGFFALAIFVLIGKIVQWFIELFKLFK